jgi:pimeloyl-ACP methyl ester carboxylesterase
LGVERFRVGQQVVDPERKFYYGHSQGGILGSAYLAWSPDIERGVLGVGGGPYSLLLTRSRDFEDFFRIFKEKYLDHRDISLFVNGLTQQLWDATEPGGWMWDMTRDTDAPKGVLMQVAINDNQVTTLGAHYQARAYGAKSLAPAVRLPSALRDRFRLDQYRWFSALRWRLPLARECC